MEVKACEPALSDCDMFLAAEFVVQKHTEILPSVTRYYLENVFTEFRAVIVFVSTKVEVKSRKINPEQRGYKEEISVWKCVFMLIIFRNIEHEPEHSP